MTKNSRGFTLMELMVAIAIIMLLSGAIIMRIGSSTESAKIAKATKECQEIATAIRAFYMDTGAWPGNKNSTNEDDVGLLNDPKVLNVNVRNEKGVEISPNTLTNYNWNGPYLESEKWPQDPWGGWYGITVRGKALVVFSRGPNGDWNSNDTAGQGTAGGDDILILVNIFED